MPAVDKVILTNRKALRAKYKRRSADVDAAIEALVRADRDRGLNTLSIDLNDSNALARYGGPRVPAPNDPLYQERNKQAVDAVWRTARPRFLLLVGSTDVIPQLTLQNPMDFPSANGVSGDPDRQIESDLPYASDAVYDRQRRVRSYIRSPDMLSRAVGRLPDVKGATDPAALLAVLATAAGYTSRQRADYESYFAPVADIWAGASERSRRAAFGRPPAVHRVPPEPAAGLPWPRPAFGRLSHYIDCHGNYCHHTFWGEDAKRTLTVTALDATRLGGPANALDGVVAACACCYGAQLYAPRIEGPHGSVCDGYLRNGAYAYFGSTSMAWDLEENHGRPMDEAKTDLGDRLCRDFFWYTLAGYPVGEACRLARVDYLRAKRTLRPKDLKTLAQFYLLADPALAPVRPPLPGPPTAVRPSSTASVTGPRYRPTDTPELLTQLPEDMRKTLDQIRGSRGLQPLAELTVFSYRLVPEPSRGKDTDERVVMLLSGRDDRVEGAAFRRVSGLEVTFRGRVATEVVEVGRG